MNLAIRGSHTERWAVYSGVYHTIDVDEVLCRDPRHWLIIRGG